MAHLLIWPGKYFFYPIGNTPATCLTRHLSPDEPAHVLLLGCGDPRHILYTVFSEPSSQTRKLDFTCCDIDAGILARNVLLFTLVLDGVSITTTAWNIFFHMYLDKASHSALIQQCTKLISHSESYQQWNASPYGSFLRMCTDYTLIELRRHWTLYAEMQDLPRDRLDKIRKEFTDLSKSNMKQSTLFSTGARSAGPAFSLSHSVMHEQFRHYWKTGITLTDDKDKIASTFLNPTFVYSLASEGCSVHYATDPMIPFHHASLFGNAKSTPTIKDLVKSSKSSFNDWCLSLKNHSNNCILRFFLGEVTAVCAALAAYADTGSLDIGIPAMRWKMPLIQLNKAEYVSAPHAFSVIDTSNLEDHIGLLNVIIAAVPLLSRSAPSSILYTESLVFSAQEDTTKYFHERLYANIAVAGLLFGVCPVDYLSSFSSHCSTGEVMMHKAGEDGQFHRVTTWKFVASGDVLLAQHASRVAAPAFELAQLGTLLYDIYHTMYEQEDSPTFGRLNQDKLWEAIRHSNILHYSRETFVLMLKLIRKNLQISSVQWTEVMTRFMALQKADSSMPMDSINYNDLCAHLYRHSVYSHPFFCLPLTKNGIFTMWSSMPSVVRIFLTIPRSALSVVQEFSIEQIGTPPLLCHVKGLWSHNVFSSIHAAFGRIIRTGTNSNPSVLFEEDEKGWKGVSPLIVSFVTTTWLLTDNEPQESLSIGFGIRSTPGTSPLLIRKFGLMLLIFSAKLTDRDHVIVIPENPLPQRVPSSSSTLSLVNAGLLEEIGTSNPVIIQLDEQCELLTSFTCRLSVQNDKVQRTFCAGETPQIAQISPCTMRLTISGYKQDITYPFPVIGSENRLRLARKSLWIEVVVPVSGPFKPDGMKLTPFPVLRNENHLIPWNIHRVNLSCLPALDVKVKNIDKWLNSHMGSMMSTRERDLRRKKEKADSDSDSDVLMYVKDTLHTIFVRAAGIQHGPPKCLFALFNEATNNCDTLFFVSNLKYDLHSHTIVCEGYVLPLTNDIMPTLAPRFHHLLSEAAGMVNIPVFKGEIQAWKQLLPAFVERCRSWSHGPNCEYQTRGKIPLTEQMEFDPLCSCGRGKDTEGMKKVALWREYAPYVTKVALTPLFAVSYMEPIGRDLSRYMCSVCRGKGKPKLKACSVCQKVRYCGSECQKKDWKTHKAQCKPA